MITLLKDSFGIWCDDHDQLKVMTRNFVIDLYTKEPCSPCRPKDWIFLVLNHSDRSWLKQEGITVEIKQALFAMGADKVRTLMASV